MGNKKEIACTYTIYAYPGVDFPDQYKNFVRSKWIRSYRYGNDFIKLADADSYFATYTYYITTLILKPETIVRLALLTEDTDVALGFSVSRGNILDYIHVHKDYRKSGIGMKLLPKNIDTFTHLTKTGMKLWPTKMPQAKFNPFA